MSALGDGLAEYFDSYGLRDAMEALRQEYGTVTAAAKAAGVDRRTWQRWVSGNIKSAKPATIAKVRQAAKISDKFVMNTSGGTRSRTLTAQNLNLAPGTMDRAMQAYVTDGAEAAEEAFVAGIQDDFYHEWLSGDLGDDYSPTEIAVS